MKIPDAVCVNTPAGCSCPDMNGNVFEFASDQCQSKLDLTFRYKKHSYFHISEFDPST